jgi:hypothetical protein
MLIIVAAQQFSMTPSRGLGLAIILSVFTQK